MAPDAWLQKHPDTPPSPLVPRQKRLVQLQLLRRHALRAAEGNIWRKKVLFQLDRIIRKQRLLEAQKRLEQLRALCWFQDDSRHKSPCLVPNSNATVPGLQCRSKWTSCSSLSLQRLYSQHVPHLHRYKSVVVIWKPLARVYNLIVQAVFFIPQCLSFLSH